MKVKSSKFGAHQIRYLELSENGLLLNTTDVLSVLGVTERPQGSDIASPCLDLTSAISITSGQSVEFTEWINETFYGYSKQTLIRPTCDDSWSFG